MARIQYWQYIVDRNGRPLQDAEVRIYLAGTSDEANIFTHPEFGSFITSSQADLKTDDNGFFEIWFGDIWELAGGYEAHQKFKVTWFGKDIVETIEDLTPFAPLLPLDTTSLDTTLNKLISNRQGKKWNDHVDSIVPSASPHDLAPVTLFSRDTKQSKVISNKLGYSMYVMASTASATPIDVSAADYYITTVSSWNTSGSLLEDDLIYWKDITHEFTSNNEYPIVRLYESDIEINPKDIKTINDDTIRIWLEDNPTVKVIISG